jgi:hypothetical protein
MIKGEREKPGGEGTDTEKMGTDGGNVEMVCLREVLIQSCVEDGADVVHLLEIREEGHEVGQLGVVSVSNASVESFPRTTTGDSRVVEPGRDGDSVVRVEDVGCRRVVDDDAVCHRTSKLREILVKIVSLDSLNSA